MRTTLKRSAVIGLLVTTGSVAAWAGIAGATCVPGTSVCVREVSNPVPPISKDQRGPADGALQTAQDTVASLEISKTADPNRLGKTADKVGRDVGDAAQGAPGVVGPIPPLPPGIRPVVERVGGLLSDLGDAAQGAPGVVGPIPPLPPGIKPVVDKLLEQLP